MHHPMMGMGLYFETPEAANKGEQFEIGGANGPYQAPVAGVGSLGRYFETPAAYNAGERFDITGVDDNYQAPVAGLDGFEMSTSFSILRLLGTAATAAGAYHGYKRSGGKIGAAIGYGILGGMFFPIAIPVYLAQGFGKKKGK